MALSSSQLVNQLDGVVDANTVVEYYVQSVIKQSDVALSALENLPAHQHLARKHAQYWRDSVNPDIQQSVTDTIHFSKAFFEKYDTLQSLINQMKKGDQKAKDAFTTTIKSLIDNLNIVIGHTKGVTTKVGDFSSKLGQDMENFRLDSKEAQKKISGDSGELKALQDQLDVINKAIHHDRVLIAGGWLIAWIAVGAGIDLKKQEKKKHNKELKLASEKQELMALNAVKSHIDGFVESMVAVSSASTSLEGGWTSLKSDFEEVITQLKALFVTDAAEWLDPLLETAKKDWMDALDKSEQLKPKSVNIRSLLEHH